MIFVPFQTTRDLLSVNIISEARTPPPYLITEQNPSIVHSINTYCSHIIHSIMSEEDPAFTNAKKIMHSIDAAKPYEDVADMVVENAPFLCQSDALKDVTTVKGWCEWMGNFATNIAPDCKPTVHNIAWDSTKKTALLYATYHAKHTGTGGPMEATNKETNTHYCYIVMMDATTNKCTSFTKVWNDGYCLKELGWA